MDSVSERIEELWSHKPSERFVRPLIMGIVNVTPDSFSDGGRYLNASIATEHALKLLAEGADIIDIGGESTRPAGKTYGEGATAITEREEIDRVLPVIARIHAAAKDAIISIDTVKSNVADLAICAGASIINDVSAGAMDAKMFEIASKHDVPIILMHGYGPRFEGKTIEEWKYQDVVAEVSRYLTERIGGARAAGVTRVLADVGIGFAKGYGDNMLLLKHHEKFASLGVPLVIGASRKSSIGKAMGRATNSDERIEGSVAAAVYTAMRGAAIIRTHDVLATRDALSVIDGILNA